MAASLSRSAVIAVALPPEQAIDLFTPDAQTSLSDTCALVALVQCLARDAADTKPGVDPPGELIEEGIFRAARFGVHGELPNVHGKLRPVSELLQETLARLRNRARNAATHALTAFAVSARRDSRPQVGP